MHKYITIEGNIGAGKTTLSNLAASHFNGNVLLERFIDNPFLPKFYEDKNRYAFSVETAFLAERYHHLHNEFNKYNLDKAPIIADYSFYKSLIFSKKTLDTQEFSLFQSLFQIINQQLPQPNLFVYLHCNIDQLLANIQKRGRPFESHISPDYLLKIEKGYEEFLQNAAIRSLWIDVSTLDFVAHNDHLTYLLDTLQKDYRYGLNKVTHPFH